MFRTNVRIVILVLAICMFGGVVQADEILEAIDEAAAAYNEKAYSEAVESLDYAKQLIMQMSSEGLMMFLPEPMDGWEGKDAKSQNLGIIGGSSGIEKEYTKLGDGNGGRGRIVLTIMGESPMLSGMMAMFNPAIAGADGGRLQKIKRNKSIVKFSAENRSGEIMINVAKKYMVIVKGNNVEKEDLMYFAEAIDYKGLKAFQ
jgi:hypothetical protein